MAIKGIERENAALLGATVGGYARDVWDDGFGAVYVLRDSMGIVGFVRATSWEEGLTAAIDEIMPDADPIEDWFEEDRKAFLAGGELPEGCLFRGVQPANPKLKSTIAEEDLNGTAFELLTEENARAWDVVLIWEDYDRE